MKQLLANNDSAALDYIHLCKLYEDIRKQQLDPWYYSCGWDGNTATLDSIAHLALQKVEAFSDSSVQRSTLNFPDRYLLLAVRAMNALRSDAECVRLWEGQGKLLTKSPLRDEMENYVAGSYLRLGQRDKAMEIYTRQGDKMKVNLKKEDISIKLEDFKPKDEELKKMMDESPETRESLIAMVEGVIGVYKNQLADESFIDGELTIKSITSTTLTLADDDGTEIVFTRVK